MKLLPVSAALTHLAGPTIDAKLADCSVRPLLCRHYGYTPFRPLDDLLILVVATVEQLASPSWQAVVVWGRSRHTATGH